MNVRLRLGWIAACLAFAGRFGPKEKKCLSAHFDISVPTISRDQAIFMARLNDLRNDAVQLDGGKIRILDPSRLPNFSDMELPSIDEWLKIMLGPRHVVVTRPERAAPNPAILREMVRSLEDRHAVFILYVSEHATQPPWRPISPHAIVNIAGRYHMRCFDHLKGRFADFVLSRMLEVVTDRTDIPAYVGGHKDEEWNRTVAVRISLNSHESPLVGRLDFGLDETGSKVIRIRQALAPYILDKRNAGFEDLLRTEIIS